MTSKTKYSAYSCWAAMIKRGTGQHNRARYFDRGITVCNRWLDFFNFIEDMGERPEGHSIDRVDNNKGYYPENCRWATNSQQARNKVTNHLVSVEGENMCLTDAAKITGVDKARLSQRLRAGWSEEKTLTTPIRSKRKFSIDGHIMTLQQMSRKWGVNALTIKARLKKGWSIDRAAKTPIDKKKSKHGKL